MDLFGNVHEHSSIKVSQELKELLLEFTMSCLLEQPSQLMTYAQNYFNTQEIELPSDNESESTEYSYDEVVAQDIEFPPDFDIADRGRGRVIYSEGYNPEKDEDDDDDIPTYEKTEEQKIMLAGVTKNCLLFRAVDDAHLAKVLDVMFPVEVQEGDNVINQYDDGDNFYIIEFGVYNVYIADEPGAEPKYIFSYNNSGSFGELALMYNMPRAATVRAASPGRLWAMDRMTFRKIVLKAAFKKRKMYEDLISKVPMLEELTTYERMSLADALLPKVYNAGAIVMQEGDVADGMYFIETGCVKVFMKDKDNNSREICTLTTDMYFGELALVKDQPRAATVIVQEETKLAFLDRAAFERILGPCMDIMRRNVDTYAKAAAKIFAEGT